MLLIGDTGQTLKKWITVHKAAVRRGDRKNRISVHAWDNDLRVDWKQAQVLDTESHDHNRRVTEAILIHRMKEDKLEFGLRTCHKWDMATIHACT